MSSTKKTSNKVNIQEPKVENLFEEYLTSLSEKELQGYEIAKSHLGSSFSLEKSNGFITWKKKKGV